MNIKEANQKDFTTLLTTLSLESDRDPGWITRQAMLVAQGDVCPLDALDALKIPWHYSAKYLSEEEKILLFFSKIIEPDLESDCAFCTVDNIFEGDLEGHKDWPYEKKGKVISQYVNTGNLWDQTVIYDPRSNNFFVTTYMDWCGY